MNSMINPPPPLDLLLIRYSEIGIKSDKVRKRMEIRLIDQIRYFFKKEGLTIISITRIGGRIILFINPEELARAATILQYVIGVHSFSPGFACKRDFPSVIENTVQFALCYLQNGDTFAIRARHSDPYPKTTPEIERELGSAVFDTLSKNGIQLQVNLSAPKRTIFVEIREKASYIFPQIIPTFWGGNPLEPDKALLADWAGQPEALAAALLLVRRGSIVIPIVFEDRQDKIQQDQMRDLRILAQYFPDPHPVFFLDIKPIVEQIIGNFPKEKFDIVYFATRMILIERILQEINTQSNARIVFMNQPLRFKGLVSSLKAETSVAWQWVQHFPFLHLTPLVGLSPETIQQILTKLHTPLHLVSFENWKWVDQIEEFSLAFTVTKDKNQSPSNGLAKIKEKDSILSEHFESWSKSPDFTALIDQIWKSRRLELIEEKLLTKI